MKDLVDQAIAHLSDDGRRLYLGNAAWPPKLKRHFRKKAAQSMRIPLRSAHRFSVTEDMQEFCKNMSQSLGESQFEALVENAAPPFECTVFENMPKEGECVLVERERWNAMDLWYPHTIERVEEMQQGVLNGRPNKVLLPEYGEYDDVKAFVASFMGSQSTKDEKKIAKFATRNSADHPVYYVRKFLVDTIYTKKYESRATGHDFYSQSQSLEVDPFGFYFCPTGFLWREDSEVDNWLGKTLALIRSSGVFPGVLQGKDRPERPAANKMFPYERKVCLSSTEFLPMHVESDRPHQRRNWIEDAFGRWLDDHVALQILSLLSTLNFDWIVDGAEPSKTGQRVRVDPDAPFNSHSEIQINLPKEKGVELALKKFHRASPLGVRRHWVRAHNRVIRKNGVPVKVIRVSEHQRGDAKLGTVTHDYVLERDHKVKA